MSGRASLGAALAAVIAAAGTLVIASRPDGRLHVTVLSTGSSSAVLIRTGDGSTMLVDGGSSPAQLLAALGRNLPPATTHLDLIVITGGEEAALNGLGGLPGHYSVGTVATPGGLNPGGNNIVAALEGTGANVLETSGAAWTFGGATARCLPFFALATGRAMCALTVRDATGSVLDLGDAGTADQEALCAVYRSAMAAGLVVLPPGGAISSVLLATALPDELAVPVAAGVPAVAAPKGYPTDRTSTDGDLNYVGGSAGLREGT